MRRALARAIALMLALAAGLPLGAGPARAQACDPAPEPVLSLSYGSRYAQGDASRSELDTEAEAEAEGALKPVDDFLRDLTRAANGIFAPDADKPAIADCLTGQIAAWARADAMSDLGSDTAKLTIGSRLAGFGIVLMQILPEATRADEIADIKAWLGRRMAEQMVFWEEEAPNGARQGNLRAWAAMGAAITATLIEDPVMRGWAAWSASYILCKAAPDGSLPQEMRRGRFALKYQLHAIAPLVITALVLERQGIQLQGVCEGALSRAVQFAVGDLATGAATAAITGKTQSFFDGTDTLEGFHLAWLEAYLLLDTRADRRPLEALAEAWRPLRNSKLGGNQTLIWPELR